MRTIRLAEGLGTVQISRQRGEVRIAGQFIGRISRRDGRWTVPGSPQGYRDPEQAAEVLAETFAGVTV
ncbi:hypothetical protein [Micromonospora sp. WMMC273]|uniref:hypothetical protein n=1 Tax=Micromonospora sp. WMMC273 TaxID=3015157 RepID=UPI0022B5F809|nr:hypothetical protein [Micromonospora sp. WMMC273]MCZ7478869.1 hypothetical protein [Micromonospora sp. WMMC273]MCZ7478978.1 hypothetical protein [Micromonospora sp. WMMC273]